MKLAQRCSVRGRQTGRARHETHLSHLSLLFLHGSQLIAFRALFGGAGRASPPAFSAESVVPFASGERTRTCFVLGTDPEPEPDAVAMRWPFEIPGWEGDM